MRSTSQCAEPPVRPPVRPAREKNRSTIPAMQRSVGNPPCKGLAVTPYWFSA